jgi:hypothetical protein
LAPIGYSSGPFSHDILCHQIKHFRKGIVTGKDGFAFGNFSKLPMVALDDISRIDYLAYLRRIFEESG